MKKQWHVVDQFDCLGEFDTAIEAAAWAERLVRDGFEEVSIHYCTWDELNDRCA
jgi:hypothetical protein